MKLTGHETRSVFDRYNSTSKADLRDAVAKLAEPGGTEEQQSAEGRVAQGLEQADPECPYVRTPVDG